MNTTCIIITIHALRYCTLPTGMLVHVHVCIAKLVLKSAFLRAIYKLATVHVQYSLYVLGIMLAHQVHEVWATPKNIKPPEKCAECLLCSIYES